MKKLKIKQEVLDELFKTEKVYKITEENIGKFFEKAEKIGSRHMQEEQDSLGSRAMSGDNVEAKDLENTAKGVMMDVGSHLDHADFIQHLVDDYKAGKIKHKPMYTTQEQVDRYKVELGKLFHTLSVKLRMAQAFGFGEIEGVVSVVDTKRLPTPQQAKKMHKDQMRKAFKKATRVTKDIDNTSTRTFKKRD